MKIAILVSCFGLLLTAFPFRTAAEDFTNAVHAYLEQRVEAEKVNCGIVAGIVDKHGSSVIKCLCGPLRVSDELRISHRLENDDPARRRSVGMASPV